MTAIVKYKTTTKTNGVELAEGTVTSVLRVSATATNFANFDTGASATVGNMTAKSPETDAEAGYLTIVVNGTTYEIPFYAIA
jgi:hypothetical protein